MNTNTMPLEAETRIHLGWKLSGKDQNVYYEQPRSEVEEKKLGGNGRITFFIPNKVTSRLL